MMAIILRKYWKISSVKLIVVINDKELEIGLKPNDFLMGQL